MTDDLIGCFGDNRSVMFASCYVVPCDSGVDFGLRFGRGHRSDVENCADEAGSVSDACYVGAECARGGHCRHCQRGFYFVSLCEFVKLILKFNNFEKREERREKRGLGLQYLLRTRK